MQAFVHGMVLSLGLILPLGIQNLFIFTQGVTQPRFLRVLPAVFTAGMCDTLLILLAVQGVSVFITSFAATKVFLLGIGIIFLAYMGWVTWHTNTVNPVDQRRESSTTRQQILFTMTVSLLNPHAILDTIAVIGTSSSSYLGHEKLWFTLSCVLISWGWFLLLGAMGWKLGKKKGFTEFSGVINKISAVCMWLSAVYMGYSAL